MKPTIQFEISDITGMQQPPEEDGVYPGTLLAMGLLIKDLVVLNALQPLFHRAGLSRKSLLRIVAAAWPGAAWLARRLFEEVMKPGALDKEIAEIDAIETYQHTTRRPPTIH